MENYNSVKNEKLETAKKHLAGYAEKRQALTEILQAMETEKCKNIDKRFFEKHFNESHEVLRWDSETRKEVNKIESWPKYSIGNPQYSFQTGYLLNLGRITDQWETLEIASRDRLEIIETIKTELEKLEKWQKEKAEEVLNIENVDEDKLVKDLQAVFTKHNNPKIWQAVLGRYDVKYPKES